MIKPKNDRLEVLLNCTQSCIMIIATSYFETISEFTKQLIQF